MLLDFPLGTGAVTVPMVRVDLDGSVFAIETDGFAERVYANKMFLWSSPNQMCKDIAPLLVKLKDGSDFMKELDIIAAKTNSAYFMRARTLFDQHRAVITAMVVSATTKAKNTFKSYQKAVTTRLKTGDASTVGLDEAYQRVLFHLEGISLQSHPDYLRYWQQTYETNRLDKSVPATNAMGERQEVLVTTPAGYKGAKLGPNIPVADREYIRWGYRQNTCMWMSESEYLKRLNALETVIPTHVLSFGKTRIHVALIPLDQAGEHLTKGLSFALSGGEVDDGGLWLPQELRHFWEPMTPTEAPTGQNLRLAVFTIEKVRIRMLAYDPLDTGTFLRSLRRFRIYSLLAAQQVPNVEVRVLPQEVRAWVFRILTGKPASLTEAGRALSRYLIELHGDPNLFRRKCQTKILEDYMAAEQINPQFAQVGTFISQCADIAFQTGQCSFQNTATNQYAYGRKERFVARFLNNATRFPVSTVAEVAQEMDRLINAVPSKYAGRKGYLRTAFTKALDAVLVPSEIPTPHQKICVWKGYTSHQAQMAAERAKRIGQAQQTDSSDSTT